MKFVIRIDVPVEKFNAAVHDGTAGPKIGRILEETKPEAMYFTTVDGKRGGFMIVDMKDVSEMVKIAEPWFLLFNAGVEYFPVMTPQDIQKAGLDQIGKTWK